MTAWIERTAAQFQFSFSASIMAPFRKSLALVRYILSEPILAGLVAIPLREYRKITYPN